MRNYLNACKEMAVKFTWQYLKTFIYVQKLAQALLKCY